MTTEQDKDTQLDVDIDGFDPIQFKQDQSHNSYENPMGKAERNQGNADHKEEAKWQVLQSLLNLEVTVGELSQKAVVFSQPLITRAEIGIIGRNTINIIQGPFGSHKSRAAELLSALMLTTSDIDDPQFLNFKRTMLERFCVCYIDTERNLTEELPFAIQGIKMRAGYRLEDKPADFRFTSIKAVDRSDRFNAIEAFISHVRRQSALHLFVLIDVVTDAIGDFNDPKDSMKLFDFLGNLCDRHNATFLLVIHQNPGTDKARGHTGTEAANKASTVMQIGFEKDASGNDSELIRLRFLKLRRGKRPEPIYLQYSEDAKGLILAGADQIADHINHRKHKADVEDMADRLTSLLSEGEIPKGDIVKTLMTEFSASNKTIRERLKTILEQGVDMYSEEGKVVCLAERTEGKNQYYLLTSKSEV